MIQLLLNAYVNQVDLIQERKCAKNAIILGLNLLYKIYLVIKQLIMLVLQRMMLLRALLHVVEEEN